LSADVLPPGGEGEIKVTLTPKPGQTKLNKQVVVHTNDPAQPSFPLTMIGEVLFDFEAKPGLVAIRELDVGSPGSARVTLQPAPGSTATLVSVDIEDHERFSVALIEAKPDGSAIYEVRYVGRDSVGNDTTRLVAKTTGPNTPELFVPVNASVVPNLRFAPRMRFPIVDGVAQERTWRITARKGAVPTISKIDDPAGLLEFVIEAPEGQAIDVRMTPKPDATRELSDEQLYAPRTLTLHTSDPEQPEIELEYRFGARAKAPARAVPAKTER
jgi:hypothetical protein